MTRNLH